MWRNILIFLMMAAVLFSGCSEQVTKKATVGAVGGGAAGLGYGLIRGDALEQMAAGALAGAMSGAAVGYLSEQEQKKTKTAAPGKASGPTSVVATTSQPQSQPPAPTGIDVLNDDAPAAGVAVGNREGRIKQLVDVANERTDSGTGVNSSGEYRIGVRDLVEIKVFQADELNHVSRVDSSGYISLPLLGRMHIANLTVSEAEKMIEKGLAESYLQDPHVTVFIQEYESQRITVEGWVKKPGIYPLKGKTTLLQAIAEAGGLDRLADAEEVAIFRRIEDGKIAGYKVDLNQVRGGTARDPVLNPNDVIVVPQNGGRALFEDITKGLRGFIGFGTIGL